MLNATELEVLRLLTLGHTVKSIARETGRTEAWINERLRDARRKSGSASSRELARRLYPDFSGASGFESNSLGHSEIDLSDASNPRLLLGGTAWLSRRSGIILGGLVMVVAIVGVVLVLSCWGGKGGAAERPASAPVRGLVSDVVMPVPSVRASHLVTIVLTSGARRGKPQSIVATEREMVSFITDDVRMYLVVTPTPAGDGAVDVALSAEFSQRQVRRRVSTTVTVENGVPFRLALPARDGAPAASIEVTIARAAGPG